MKRFFIMAAAAMTVFAACNKTEYVYDNDQPQEIGFFAVNKAATKTTGAVDGTTFPTDYAMQVAAYLAAGDGVTAGDYFGGTTFSKNGSYWTGGKYWPVQGATINFLAVAPETTGVATTFGTSNYASASETTLTSNETNQYDVMYAAGQGVKTTGAAAPEKVDMVFKHALSWINFTFKTTTDPVIKINKVTMNGAKYNGTLTVTNAKYNTTDPQAATAAWSETSGNAAVVVPGADSGITLVKDAAAAAFGNGLLVIPGSATSFVINYTVTIDGVAHTYNYTYDLTSTTWDEAKRYTYNVTINLTQININPSVASWDNPGTQIPVDLQ